jgi:hypothetical protein
MGDVVPLTDVCEVELVPQYGSKMDSRLNANTSLELAENFYLNDFADKETFRAIELPVTPSTIVPRYDLISDLIQQ